MNDIPIPNGQHDDQPPKSKSLNLAQMRAFLDIIVDPSVGCYEVRIIQARWDRGRIVRADNRSSTVAGWFDNIDSMGKASTFLKDVSAFILPNPVPNNFLRNESSNWLIKRSEVTKDKEVTFWRWFLIDFDAKRVPKTISSTDEELAYAVAKRDRVLDEVPGLRESSIWGKSGNGAWILPRLADLENCPETAEKIARVLNGLHVFYSDEHVDVDAVTKNIGRVVPFVGTLKCKGQNHPDRPWRLATLDSPGPPAGPLDLDRVIEHLVSVAALNVSQPPNKAVPSHLTNGGLLHERVIAYLNQMAPAVEGMHGHDQTLDAAAVLVQGFAMDPQEAFPYLSIWNQTCQPPWEDKDLWHKLEDALELNNSGKTRGYLLQGRDGAEPGNVAEEDLGCPAGTEDNPHRLARVYYYEKHQHPDGPTLCYWGGQFHAWTKGGYEPLPPKDLRGELTQILDTEFTKIYAAALVRYASKKPRADQKESKAPTPIKVSTRLMADVTQALAGISLLTQKQCKAQPAWLWGEEKWPATEMLATQNALVHIYSFAEGKPDYWCLPTPRLFSPYALDYEFNPDAGDPINWLTFLGSRPLSDECLVKLQVWPDDPDSIDTLQEWMGLQLIPDTSYQKIGALIGPRRCGKGTISRVIKALVGASNVTGPTLSGLGEKFGLEPLIGKLCAIIDDARMGSKSDQMVILERLLSISGEGSLSVPTKWGSNWEGQLTPRITYISNDLPRLSDASKALTGRFILMRFTRSFYGQEDRNLFQKFLPELPQILVWAIKGLVRLKERDAFLQPETGTELLEEMGDLSSPIGQFVHERCLIGPYKECPRDDLYDEWKEWCLANGKTHVTDKVTFGKDLRSILPDLGSTQHQTKNGRVRYYKGVDLGVPRPVLELANW